jgi:hypothetical protein
MKRLHETLSPSETDLCRQDWKRDPSTWRERFFARNAQLAEDPHDPVLVFGTRAQQIADSLEAYFETALPKWK